MKYTIMGFSQKMALEYEIDYVDLSILSYIKIFYPRMMKMDREGKEFVWFSMKGYKEEYPLSHLDSEDSLRRRMVKLEEKGIIERYTQRKSNGTFSYVYLTNKYYLMISDTHPSENRDSHPSEKGEQKHPSEKGDQIDPLTNKKKTKGFIELDYSFLNNEPLEYLFKEWLRYKKEDIKNPIKTQNGIETSFKHFKSLVNNDVEKGKLALEFSKGKEYKDIYLPNNSFVSKAPAKSFKQIEIDRGSINILMSDLEERGIIVNFNEASALYYKQQELDKERVENIVNVVNGKKQEPKDVTPNNDLLGGVCI